MATRQPSREMCVTSEETAAGAKVAEGASADEDYDGIECLFWCPFGLFEEQFG